MLFNKGIVSTVNQQVHLKLQKFNSSLITFVTSRLHLRLFFGLDTEVTESTLYSWFRCMITCETG